MPLQRGHLVYAELSIHMRLYCYRSHAPMPQQEQLWSCSEYVHVCAIEPYAEFYIREDRLSFALLIDPDMLHLAYRDLYI